jgi:hypothetical protein
MGEKRGLPEGNQGEEGRDAQGPPPRRLPVEDRPESDQQEHGRKYQPERAIR